MQPKIEIRHSCIAISNYTRGDCPRLEQYLQVWDKGRFCYNDVGFYIDDKTRTLYLPAGIQRWVIQKNFPTERFFTKVYPDNYMKVKQIHLKYAPRDQIQTEAIDFCIGGEKYPGNRKANQIFLNLNTGAGKSYCIIAISAYFSIKTAVLMYAQSWLAQWRNYILEYTDTKQKEIYTILGTKSIERLLSGQVNHKPIKYYLISLGTIREYGDTHGWGKVRELFRFLYIGIKVYDEAHLQPENLLKIDFFTDVWKTYYVTATPMLSDTFKNIVYQRSFSTVPKIDLFNEKTDPHTDYQCIKFNSHPTAVDLNRCQSKYGFNIIWYANYLPTKREYYQVLWLLMDWVIRKLSTAGKVLIYIGTNQSIKLTYHWLKYMYPFHTIGIFTTLYGKEEKKKQLDRQIILSTTKSAGLAVDIKGLEYVIDLADPSKSAVVIRQKLGRTRDWDTLFIDVIDVGFPAIRRFAQERLKVFKKYARCIRPEVVLNDSVIRDNLMRIRRRDERILKQLQARKNLKEVMTIKKQVMVFKDEKYNYCQNYDKE